MLEAKEAWIAYSTPLWRRAGRSEAWIAQNIFYEWATNQDDIVRRYLAGDFGEINGNGEIDPELLERAKQAWIVYSTPLWRRAGRSEAWIAQNIIDEWETSKEDIIRRYL
nr:hypothetical protein [Clostridia bacterium]